MKTTVAELIKAIIDENSMVYTNDGGNGCGGPGSLSVEELQEMLENDDFSDYEIVTETPDGDPETIIAETLSAHCHDDNDTTKWILAMRQDDDGQTNPYRHYLLLWDAR